MELALAHEQGVSGQIDRLYELAFSEKVFAAMAELQWFITEQVEAKRTLVLVPSLSLLSQTLASWTADATTRFRALAVCSDESVTSTDEAVAHTTDLGVPVTTDPDQIGRWWTRNPRYNIAVRPPVGYAVLDVDPRNGGTDNLLALLD